MSEKILVVGHRNPDNDAVCAAVGFAAYCNAVDKKSPRKKERNSPLNSRRLC